MNYQAWLIALGVAAGCSSKKTSTEEHAEHHSSTTVTLDLDSTHEIQPKEIQGMLTRALDSDVGAAQVSCPAAANAPEVAIACQVALGAGKSFTTDVVLTKLATGKYRLSYTVDDRFKL